MISYDLEHSTRSITQEQQRKALAGITGLNLYLRDCKTPEDVIPLLRIELKGLGRMSFITRIYGRYRKLLPTRDYKEMHAWAQRQ